MCWIVFSLIILLLIPAAVEECYQLVFSVPKKGEDAIFALPETEQYRPFAETTGEMIRAALDMEYEPVSIVSHDGLKLFGKVYASGAATPWLILFHGYRSRAERDFCGGLRFGVESGYNVLLVDQRAHGRSEGKCLSFGVLERRDCLSWVNFVVSRAGEGAKIVLYGMSMGAATVLMAAGLKLPENVVGIVADCGYTAPEAIIKTVIRKYHLPVFPIYPLIRLGGRLFGGFDLEEASAARAMDECDIPVLFIHGGDDRFVPCDMGRENYAHCRSAGKELLIVPGAGHGMSYMVDKTAYLTAVSTFLNKIR